MDEMNWALVGPMPSDPDLDAKLEFVKHENNHPRADESEWRARSAANAEGYQRVEENFFSELDKRLASA